MGDAFIAISDDNNGIYWNPAGLSQIKRPALSSMYGNWLTDINIANLSYISPLDRYTYGLSFSYINYGNIEETTLGQPGGTGRVFNPTNYILYSSLAYKLNPFISFGVNGKYLTETIDNSVASGYGADASMFWSANDQLALGACARNILGKLGNYSLPSNYGLGMSYKWPSLIIAADYNMPNDNSSIFNLGFEYNYKNILFGRLGYNTRSEELAGGNMGVGLALSLSSLKFDYAFVPYGELGSTHRFSLNIYPFEPYISSLTEIIVSPDNITVMEGKKINFIAKGYDKRFNAISITPIWEVFGDIGSIDQQSGSFYAKKTGSGYITAKSNDIIGEAVVTVIPAVIEVSPAVIEVFPTVIKESPAVIRESPKGIKKLVIIPSNPIIKLGDSIRFKCIGYDDYGNEIEVKPIWTTTGKIGTISETGEFITYLSVGQGEVIAKFGDLTQNVPIRVIP
jgi:hypothetical protein